MEEQKTTAGQGLGIAGLILGILAIPLALLGCTFILALFLGAAGVVLSAIGLHQANTANGTKGLPIGGLSVSIVGLCIALMWGLFFTSAVFKGGKLWKDSPFWEQIGKEVEENLQDSFKDLEDEFDQMGEDLEDVLEDLEYSGDFENIDWNGEISDEELTKVLNTYEELIGDYISLVGKADNGDVSAIAEYAKVSTKAIALATKLTAIAPKLSDEQRAKFEDLQKKYKEALEKTEQPSE
jgi:Skp family chaperone for outer membrane proteins